MKSVSHRIIWGLFGMLVPFYSHALSLGGGGTGLFAKLGKFLQEIVNFLGGTGTMFVVFISCVGAICLWVMVPKQAGAAIAWLFRACCGAIALFGISVLITWIKGF